MEIEPIISPEESRACLKVLSALITDRTQLGVFSPDDRKELLILAGKLSRPDKLESIRLNKMRRRTKKQKEKHQDRAVVSTTHIRTARQSAVFIAPPQLATGDTRERVLIKARYCYVCKVEYNKLHFFYDSMCEKCGDYNYGKRFQTTSLVNRVALITGGRLKIGYQSALILLRAGARVIVTTRFPVDAAMRFSREADFADWRDRLQLHGLDLRHSPSVEQFTEYLNETCDRLDFLINNAAQTVRRPPGFYAHLMANENRAYDDLPAEIQGLLRDRQQSLSISKPLSSGEDLSTQNWVAQLATRGGAIGLRIPSALSQIPCLPEDSPENSEAHKILFPEGKVDADLQQVDLRPMNSWRMRLADVPTPELLEVQLVNSIAPFILCSKLKPLMMRQRTNDKHIVNVSAMEGKFTRYTKTDKHPHTNMAKAALNMMTLTSARDYVTDGIFMNAVDTGWVTDEDPAEISARKEEEHDFQPPLDIVDGAARVCDPFLAGIISGEHVWGQFLKDYRPTSW